MFSEDFFFLNFVYVWVKMIVVNENEGIKKEKNLDKVGRMHIYE